MSSLGYSQSQIKLENNSKISLNRLRNSYSMNMRNNSSLNKYTSDVQKNQYNYHKNFELNNQGCKCKLCQKLIINQNLKIITQQIYDPQSQCYHKEPQQEFYIKLIQQISNSWKFKRSIRFAIPQTCLYQHLNPFALFEKKKQSLKINVIKHKAHLHFFEIQNFFFQGYMLHNPNKKQKKTKNQAINKQYLNQCILFAKYKQNYYRMLTYKEIQNLFRSKNKHMKQGLMYLQTIVGGQSFKTINVRINIAQINENQITRQLWERAKRQVKMIVNQIKQTDLNQYYEEKQQIQFQNSLKQSNLTQYLVYLSYKILLLNSKLNEKIMKSSIFKYVFIEGKVYLFDLRVSQFQSSFTYWSSNVVQALQIKLKKRMQMMQHGNPQILKKFQLTEKNLSQKAMNLQSWLNNNTQGQWNQMKIIRKRLQKLQAEKISLKKSQELQGINKAFKVRNFKKRLRQQTTNISLIL